MIELPVLRDLYRTALPEVEREPLARLPDGIFSFVWKVSGAQQIRLLLLTALVFPLSMAPLELQRRIVNGAVSSGEVDLIVSLGLIYLGVILIQGALKYLRNLYLGRVSEGVIRRLRTRVLRTLESDQADQEKLGSRVEMISAETERLGGFVGEALAQPLLSAGILLTVSAYMLWTEPLVAMIAFGFFIPALVLAPWLQGVINRHEQARTEHLRGLSDKVVTDHGEQTRQGAEGLEQIAHHIYKVRVKLFVVKFFAKFFNNFMASIGLLAVLVAGAILVVQGQTEIGVVVAFMSGFERISEPARELMTYYRQQSQMRVQYDMLREELPTVAVK